MYNPLYYLLRRQFDFWIYGKELDDYLRKISVREHPIQKELREYTDTLSNYFLVSSPITQTMVTWLVKFLNPKKTLDIGVFTGYSALSVALASAPDAKIFAMEYNPKIVETARKYWEKAGISNKITTMIGKANDYLDQLINEGHEGTFDFSFIDADKGNYIHYYEKSLKLLRKGGVIAIDNTLWKGATFRKGFLFNALMTCIPKNMKDDATILKKLNETIYKDKRVEIVVLPIDDGLTLCRKL